MRIKILFLLIILLVIAQTAIAVDDSIFAKAGIMPPPIPNAAEEADLASEEAPTYALELTLKDKDNKELVSDIHVIVEIHGFSRTIKYVDESGILRLNLEPNTYTIVLKVDILNTSGSDYYIEQDFMVNDDLNETVYLLPAGSVRGIVTQDGTTVPSASIKFDCPGNYGDKQEVVTDKFGSFSKDWLPISSCKILATDRAKVGNTVVQINKGSMGEVEIVLDKNVRMGFSFIWIIVIIVIISIGVLAFHLLVVRRSRKPAVKEEVHNKRLKDVVKTLNKREKEIVEIIFKDGEVNQSKIIHQTGIPKTSIVRIFENLQNKNIIEVNKLGKAKKIRLTDWIMEKE